MTSRPLIFLVVIVLIIAALAGYGYLTRGERHFDNTPPISDVVATTNPEVGDQGPTSPLSTTTPITGLPNSIDTSSWQIYVNHTYGYSLEYPRDIVASVTNDVFSLSFPKNLYFRWPLEDDAKVSVTSGRSCASVIGTGKDPGPIVTELLIGDLTFKKSIGSEIVGGNRFLESAYDTVSRGNCYHISFFDRGTNGASVYVDSKDLVEKYDAQHVDDLNAVTNIIGAMIKTFHILAPTQ